MIDVRPARLTNPWLMLALAALTLQACSKGPGPTASGSRVYAADVTGAAKSCDVPSLSLTDGKTVTAAIKVTNDGGWCGITVAQPGPKPYASGLLTARPTHGKVFIHQVGDNTRIDYTPDRGFAGTDNFSVKLLPGEPLVHVTVTASK